MSNSELVAFRQLLEDLRKNPLIKPRLRGDVFRAAELSLDDVSLLVSTLDAPYYFLIAAAGLNRTTLKSAAREPTAMILPAKARKAFAVRDRLPATVSFRDTVVRAASLREGDLGRKKSGGIEGLFRDRLKAESIPICMSPPIRHVPGVLVSRRKPDGVYPDPALDKPPGIYLEIKNIRRVSDDIQKRLYELAEASLEMKALYGDLQLKGLGIRLPSSIATTPEYRDRLRSQIVVSLPVVVGLFLCSRAEAERYRPGAETFVDRIFFQEEIDECVSFLREAVKRVDGS